MAFSFGIAGLVSLSALTAIICSMAVFHEGSNKLKDG